MLFVGAALLVVGCGDGQERATADSAVASANPVSVPPTGGTTGTGGGAAPESAPVTTTSAAGTDQTLPPTPATSASTTSTAPPALTVEPRSLGGRLGEPADGELLLWVSNQSFEDDPVSLTVTIDGQQVVADEFEVENQHNWIGFFVKGLPPGEHEVTARSDTGVDVKGSFTLPEGEPRWLVLDYWFYRDDPEGRHITFSEHNQAVMFM